MNVIRKYKGIWQRGERWLWKQIRKMRALIGPTHFLGHVHPWMIRGFSGFQVLVAGNELGLFKLLSDNPNRSVQEVATNLGIPPHSADALMLCCNSLGLVKMNRRNGTYRNTPSIERNYGGPGKGELIEVLHALMYPLFLHDGSPAARHK